MANTLVYVLPSLALAQQCAALVDASRGYPKAGVDVPGGVHVSPTFVTVTHWVPTKHPTLAQYAYIADPVAASVLASQAAALGLPAPAPFDPTWVPTATIAVATGT